MKNLIFFIIFAFTLGNTFQVVAQKKSDPAVFFKSSMDCVDCERKIFEHLRFERGVKDLKIDHVSNTIKIVYDEKRSNEETLKKAIEKKGYAAEKISDGEYSKLHENAGKKPQSPGHKH